MWNTFRLNMKGISLVEYKCPTRTEGNCNLALAAFYAVVLGSAMIAGQISSLWTIVLTVAFVAAVALYGWFLRCMMKTPKSRTVTLGTWGHQLYLRNKVLFVAYETGKTVLAVALFVTLLVLVEGGSSLTVESWLSEMGEWLFILLFAANHVTERYLDFYEYYRLPEGERQAAAIKP